MDFKSLIFFLKTNRFQLPRSDQTPALEVNLTPTNDSANATSSEMANSHVVVQIETRDVNTQRNPEAASIIATQVPSSSELPSYLEALRLKKIESGEIPPSYYTSINGDDSRIPIENPEVHYITTSLSV